MIHIDDWGVFHKVWLLGGQPYLVHRDVPYTQLCQHIIRVAGGWSGWLGKDLEAVPDSYYHEFEQVYQDHNRLILPEGGIMAGGGL